MRRSSFRFTVRISMGSTWIIFKSFHGSTNGNSTLNGLFTDVISAKFAVGCGSLAHRHPVSRALNLNRLSIVYIRPLEGAVIELLDSIVASRRAGPESLRRGVDSISCSSAVIDPFNQVRYQSEQLYGAAIWTVTDRSVDAVDAALLYRVHRTGCEVF